MGGEIQIGAVRDFKDKPSFLLNTGAKILGQAGEYEVVGRIGDGGFAAVYSVRRVKDGRVMALKMSLDANNSAEGAARIHREISVMRKCSSINADLIPKIEDEGDVDGRPFFVMENLQALSWSTDEDGLPDSEVQRRDFLVLLIECVKAIHAAGYLHCDIKPTNIMERPGDHRPLLIDFGSAHPIVASVVEEEKTGWVAVTQPGSVAETPGYAADQDCYTIQKDIFSLGQVIRDCFEDDVPITWSHVINKCISRRAKHRYDSLDKLIADIEHVDELDIEEMRKRVVEDRERRIERQSAIYKGGHLKVSSRRLLLKRRNGFIGGNKLVCDESEYFVRCGDWSSSALEVYGRVDLGDDGLLVIQGPGYVLMRLRSIASKHHPAKVLLMNGATLVNQTEYKEKEYNPIRYYVGDSCYLNISAYHPDGEATLRKILKRDVAYCKTGYFAVGATHDIAEYIDGLKEKHDHGESMMKAKDFFADDDDPKSLAYCFMDEMQRIATDM